MAIVNLYRYVKFIALHIGVTFIYAVFPLAIGFTTIFTYMNDIKDTLFQRHVLKMEIITYLIVGLSSGLCRKSPYKVFNQNLHDILTVCMAITGFILAFIERQKHTEAYLNFVQLLLTSASVIYLLLIFKNIYERGKVGSITLYV